VKLSHVKKAAALVWAASIELEPNLASAERVDAAVLAMARLLPEDASPSLATGAIAAHAMEAD
tara:strand:- start:1981 stop:2169 length:189 start_codon:yes stop_codon:yes gene_type:complete